MLNFIKKKNHGFTLIEIVMAIGILAMLGGFVIVSMSVVPKARMKELAQTIKSEFELARDFAKTHGGDSSFIIEKSDVGVIIKRTSDTVKDEEKEIKDADLAIYYKLTGDATEYELGYADKAGVVNENKLEMTFSQTDGSVLGPHYIDYIEINNGTKSYKFFIKQTTGMNYYDYEIDDANTGNKILNEEPTFVKLPSFIERGLPNYPTTNVKKTGTTVQPEISYDSRYVKISGEYRAKEVGTYTITFSLKDPYTTIWESGDKEDKTLVWKIID